MLLRTVEKQSLIESPRDSFGRPLRDLRLSVIDRCNFRCSYCMPEDPAGGEYSFLSRQDLLHDDEIVRLVTTFVKLGVTRVRITGGEPLLRPRLVGLINRIHQVAGIEDLSMTTNGILLPRLADALKEAGLRRITVSLDSLDEAVFTRMTGRRGTVSDVLAGIQAAATAGFPGLKINCVVQRGVNDHTVMDLVEHFRGSGHIVRLIEFLDVGSSNEWSRRQVISGAEWLKRIHQRWPLRPLQQSRPGKTAQRFAFEDGQGEIGLINSISQPFCGHCNRARVTADGMLHTCLFNGSGSPLRPLLGDDCGTALEDRIRSLWSSREDRYSEIRHLNPVGAPGQEMFRMGG